MITRKREPNPGRSARRGRSRSKSLGAAISFLLLASLMALAPGALPTVPGAAPAAADTTVTTAVLALACTAQTPIGTEEAEQDLTIDIEHPTGIARNAVETVELKQPAMEIPDEVGGFNLNHIKDVAVTISVPSQFRIDDARVVQGTLEPGAEWAAAQVSYTPGGEATLSIPGPLVAGRTYQIPELHVDLVAVGTPGTSGGFRYQSFQLTANASVPIFGNTDVPTTCPAPSPNPPLFSIDVLPGDFSVDPDPELNVGEVVQPTVAKYGGTVVPTGGNEANGPRTDIEFGFVAEHLLDTEPGEELVIALTPPSRDWTGFYASSPHTTGSRRMSGYRNLSFELGGPDPAVFDVVSVESADPTAMDATYDPVTNRIHLTPPQGQKIAAGTALALPEVTVTLRGLTDGSTYATSHLTFERVGFDVAYQTESCFLIFCSWSGDTWMGATTQGAMPGAVPAGTQPNNSLYFAQVAGGTVLTTFGVSNPPGANDDHVTVANNVSGVNIDVLANDVAGTKPFDKSTVTIVDDPEHGEVTINPVSGVVTYTPDYGTMAKLDGFTYAVQDVGGRWTNVASVTIDIVGIYCEAPCSLEQVITVDVDPDALSMAQGSGSTILDPITLDGDAQWAQGELNPLTVTNRRGTAADWSLTGQLESDFRAPDSNLDCPVDDESSWDFRCIPGDNLGWEPMAAVAHEVVPGDVADVTAGPEAGTGLRSTAHSLCTAPEARAGGTFSCGAVLSLGVPASAAAQGYSATITLTLA